MSVLFIDTNCELNYKKAKELGLNVIRMPYTICDQEYFFDLGENYDPHKFFTLEREGNMPITSGLNAENYKEYFEPFFAKDEDILYVSFSSKLSGTFAYMETAIEELKEKLFPQLVNSLTNLDLDRSLEYFRKHNYLLNKRVKAIVNNQTFIGEVVGIDDSFCLQVASHGMLLHIDSGEIEILWNF